MRFQACTRRHSAERATRRSGRTRREYMGANTRRKCKSSVPTAQRGAGWRRAPTNTHKVSSSQRRGKSGPGYPGEAKTARRALCLNRPAGENGASLQTRRRRKLRLGHSNICCSERRSPPVSSARKPDVRSARVSVAPEEQPGTSHKGRTSTSCIVGLPGQGIEQRYGVLRKMAPLTRPTRIKL